MPECLSPSGCLPDTRLWARALVQTLAGCGDAIRLEAQPGSDVNAVLDNTVWFDTITDSRVGEAAALQLQLSS